MRGGDGESFEGFAGLEEVGGITRPAVTRAFLPGYIAASLRHDGAAVTSTAAACGERLHRLPPRRQTRERIIWNQQGRFSTISAETVDALRNSRLLEGKKEETRRSVVTYPSQAWFGGNGRRVPVGRRGTLWYDTKRRG